jgi:hypothetical protein
MATASRPTKAPTTAAIKALEKAIRDWWKAEQEKWVHAVDDGAEPGNDSDLWDDMPVVESKQIARTGKLFEEHLGTKLDVKLIRAGGYESIEDVISDLVPKMVAAASKSGERA